MFDLPKLPHLDVPAMDWARRRHESLTKPPGSLGRLEDLAIRIVGITGNVPPTVARKRVITVAADHGVVAEGVSAYPAEVTPQMVKNILFGGAAVSVLARGAGADVLVVDAGVAADLEPHPSLLDAKIRRGSGNLRRERAMTRAEAEASVMRGVEIGRMQAEDGINLLGIGDMGIGNTTPSSAITAVYTGCPASSVTGRGTGINADQLLHKVKIIEDALSLHAPDISDPIDVLSALGGLEIAVIAGIFIGAASVRIPVVIDGFISSAGALIACELAPGLARFLIPSHSSVESGHRVILERLELAPVLALDMRLGEGTGAVLAFSLVDQAIRIINEMATFAEAGISGRSAEMDRAMRFQKRREGYLFALEGGIWDDPFRHVDGNEYRHIVSTDLDKLVAWAQARGLPRHRIVRRDLRDFRSTREKVAAWHIDLGGPFLGIES